MHIFFFPFGIFFSFFQVVTDYTASLLTLYIKCFLGPFSNCAGILCLLLHCLSITVAA